MAYFSTTLKVPVEELKSCAKIINKYSTDPEYQNLMVNLFNHLDVLRSSGEWRGSAINAACRITKNNERKYEEIMDELGELGEFLDQYANYMAGIDKQESRKIVSA